MNFLLSLLGRLGGPAAPCSPSPVPAPASRGPTVAEALPRFLESRKSRGLRAVSLQNYGIFSRSLTAEWGDRRLPDIGPEDFRRVLERRSENYGQLLKVFLRWAHRDGLVRHDATHDIRVQAHFVDYAPISYLTPSEAQRFFNAVSEEYRAAFALAMYGGLRPYEVCRIDWSAISVQERRIRLEPSVSKIRRMRIIEDVPTILWAQLALTEQRAGPVMRRSTHTGLGEPGYGVWAVERRRAAKVAHVALPHDVLRHSFATYFVALTGSPDRCAKILGHYDLRMLATHYDGVATKDDAEQYFHPKPTLALPAPAGGT